MSIKILDGAGTGREAKVNSDGRILVQSVSDVPILEASTERRAFHVVIPEITLTSAAESGVFYIVNIDPDRDLYMAHWHVSLGTSTGGSGDALVCASANATTGTLISAGTAVEPVNLNLGSSIPPQATILYGAEGSTITNGDSLYHRIVQTPSLTDSCAEVVVPNSATICLSVTPPTGNTSLSVRGGMQFYYRA